MSRLADSGWGAGATMLWINTLALVHSTAECCAPVWCCSAHTRFIDPAINDALRIAAGCLRPTPGDNLSIIAGIQPAELHRNGATLSLARRTIEPSHLLHSVLTCPPTTNARRLNSRHPFVPAAQQRISLPDNNQYTCGTLGGSPMECAMGRQLYKAPLFYPRHPHFHPRHPHSTLRNDPPKKSLGPA